MCYELTIGFITYGKSTAKYLPYFLSSLRNQTFNNYNIIAFDNSESFDNENIDYIKNNYPEIKILSAGKNTGFARAYNKMIKTAAEAGSKYFLVINPDIILEQGAIERMIKVIDNNKELGSVCPKILRWDFQNNKKTNIIDTCGIKEISALRFKDIGQGEVDNGQYDNIEILGPSGAAAMYRISALEKIKISPKHTPNALSRGSYENIKNEYFDELMFMYEEDCDLAYRLKLSGYKSRLVAESIIYHDRTASANGTGNLQVAINRKNKSRQVKSWGFLHKHIMFIKYWRILSTRQKLDVLWFAFKMFVFALIFEQYLLRQYCKLCRTKKNIKRYSNDVDL